MQKQEFKEALSYDDISLLPNFSDITSRKEVDTTTKISRNSYVKIPIILSPMDTVSSVKSCIKMNKIGGAGVLHRFMTIDDQKSKAKTIKDESNFCVTAIGLKDAEERISSTSIYTDVYFLDTANGLSKTVEDFLRWYKISEFSQDIIVGNTLTKESVFRLANLRADGFRHLIGPGSMCLTQVKTGIGCPSVTGLSYAWEAIRNYQLANADHFSQENPKEEDRPSILADGGIRNPRDLVKAIIEYVPAVAPSGADKGEADKGEAVKGEDDKGEAPSTGTSGAGTSGAGSQQQATGIGAREKNYKKKPVIPEADDATSQTQRKPISKSGYCFVGEDKWFRSCIEVGEGDICMSGDIFPTQAICINPNLRE